MAEHASPSDRTTRVREEVKVRGSELVEKVRELLRDASARRIIIKRKGRIILSFSVPTGAGSAALAILLAPKLAALSALALLVSNLEVIVERESTKDVVVQTGPERGQQQNGDEEHSSNQP